MTRTNSKPRPASGDPNDGEDATKSVLSSERNPNDEHRDDFSVPFRDKSIICEQRGGTTPQHHPCLIFTHGAGGGLNNPATKDFAVGFAHLGPVVGFQGTMNLQSRVKTFNAVTEHLQWSGALGGRSMGARAAVMARTEETKALVLVSYPLIGGKRGDVRDRILLGLPSDVDVLFVIGADDNMCPKGQLDEVVGKMKARTWMVQVEGADHSMSVKAKAGVQPMRERTGAITAAWLVHRDSDTPFLTLSWDAEAQDVVDSGWLRRSSSSREAQPDSATKPASKKRRIK